MKKVNLENNNDILKELENSLLENKTQDIITYKNINEPINEIIDNSNIDLIETFDSSEFKESINSIELEKDNTSKVENKKTIKKNKFISYIFFLFKYIITSVFIFGILLAGTNYSAYINIAKSYIYKSEMADKKQKIINSVEASNLKEKYSEIKLNKIKTDKTEIRKLSIKKMKQNQNKKNIDLNIEITPYENRLIIPRIGKNIPLLDVKNRTISGEKELNAIFMKELEDGVVRYPSSAKPGQKGNSFIFGHSSNFPWIKGDYNDIFSTLDNVVYGDKLIVYYGQKKYTYVVREKKIVSPGDVSALNRNKNIKEITLMTCWPIGTTLNRLLVIGTLEEVE